ncbi:MAG: hypothetical protein ABIL44_09130 [candidate division WOR-3 bacterium]
MLSKRTLMITIISALCLVSLAGAEEGKSESKIEPKLVYEKHFDFEIEQGKIGDDGSLFPTIFVTKDNRVLFLDENGNVHKTLSFTWPNYIAKISDDGKNVIVMTPFNRDKNEFDVKIYGTSGKVIVQKRMSFTTGVPVDIFLTKGAKDVIIFFAGGDLVEPCGIGFYDGKLDLRKLYTRDDFERPLVPGSYWRNPGFNGAWLNEKEQSFLIGVGSNINSYGVYIFEVPTGELKYYEYFDTLVTGRCTVSNDGTKFVCVACESYRKIFDKNGQNILSYIIVSEQNKVKFATMLSRDSKPEWLPEIPLVFSQNNHYLVAAFDDTIFLYNFRLSQLTKLHSPTGKRLNAIDVTNDRSILITDEKGTISILDSADNLIFQKEFARPLVEFKYFPKTERLIMITPKGAFNFILNH